MRAVIVCGGTLNDYGYIKGQIGGDDVIICADSGYNHAVNMGLDVEIVVGDFDSVKHLPPDMRTLRYPARKDYTDTELAIEHARSVGFKDFLIVAALGNRMDHSVTNILMLKDFAERGEKVVLLDESNRVTVTDSTVRICGKKGAVVSLVPVTYCSGVTSEGLEYPLDGIGLHVGKGLGISNVMTADEAVVSVKSGILLVMVIDE